jgi:hypothetical protein
MKNKLMALAIIGVFVIAGISGLVIAKGPPEGKPNGPPEHARGPADKATGNVTVDLTDVGGTGYLVCDFDAHESKGDRPAKGEMAFTSYKDDGTFKRLIVVDVEYVEVNGNTAEIEAVCTQDTNGALIGWAIQVEVIDGGTPGTAGDYIEWTWQDGWNGGFVPIAGNLVVHS